MPSNIQQALPTTEPVATPIGGIANNTAADVAQSVAAVTSTLINARKTRVLSEVAQESQNVVTQTAAYQQSKDNIVASMSNADKATFDQLSGQLERLRKGEVQGVLSPQAANSRLQLLAKTYINKYPRMALEIRQMLKLISGDIAPDTKADDIGDPVLKAQYALVNEAVTRGTSTENVIQLNRQKDATESSKLRLEQAQATGNFQLPKLMYDLIDNKSSEIFSELISGMVGRIKTGTFVKENELTGIRQAQAQGMIDLNRELTQYELENGVRVDHDKFEQRLKSAYEPLIALANEADSSDKQSRLAGAQEKILRATDYKYLHDAVGAFAPIAINSPENSFKIMEEFSKTVDMIVKGQLPSLEAAAKYDPKTRMILDGLKSNGKAWESLMQRVGEISDGKPPTASTGDAAIDRLSGKILLDTAAQPGQPIAESGKLLANYIMSKEPIDAVLSHRRVHQVLKQSPEAQKALDTQALDSLVSAVDNLPMSELRKIEVNPADPKEPFKSMSPYYENARQFNYSGAEAVPFALPSPLNKFTDTMNQYSQLMGIYKDPTEIQAETQNKFHELLQARVQNEMQAISEIVAREGGHGAVKDGQPQGDEGGVKTTQVDGNGSELFKYDPDSESFIDTRTGKPISPSYNFSPQEVDELQKAVDALQTKPTADDLKGAE